MEHDHVLLSIDGAVATITLNRPEVLNALSAEMSDQMVAALDTVEQDERVRVVVITGAGRAFCAGGDIKTMHERARNEVAAGAHGIVASLQNPARRIPVRLHALRQPVIAAINGAAAGWGFDLAMACDIRIAADSARFAEAFVRRGLVPDGGGAWTLPRIVGLERACDLIFTGRTFDAAEALRLGVVGRVTPAAELAEAAGALAAQIAANAPLSLQLAKRMIYDGLQQPFTLAMQQTALFLTTLRRSEDHAESVTAFLEKREPVFKGR